MMLRGSEEFPMTAVPPAERTANTDMQVVWKKGSTNNMESPEENPIDSTSMAMRFAIAL